MTITSAEAAKLDGMCKVAQDATLGTEVLAHQASIATNVSDIADNVTDIGTNLASITALEAVVGGSGEHAVTSGEATANTLDIDTGVTITGWIVQVYRAGANVTADAAISAATTVLTVADGAATLDLAENDVIHYIVW